MRAVLSLGAVAALSFCVSARTFENRFVRWEIGDDACVSKLTTKKNGYQLVKERIPFVAAVNAKGELVPAVGCRADGNELRFTLKDGGKVTLAVSAFDGGWTFETKDCELKDAESLWFVRLRHATGRYFGTLANAVSDDRTALFVRGYDAKTEMYCAGETAGADGENHRFDGAVNGPRIVCAGAMKAFGFNGHRAGLAAAMRDDILPCMRAMTIVAGAPHSTAGGAWAMDSEANRGSYLFATSMDLPSLDDWIALMERGGFDLLHFHVWWKLYGSYEVDTDCFPNGYDDIRAAVEKVKKAGFRAGTHTLSACLEWGSKCLTPVCDTNLVAVHSYTLAKPFGPEDTEFFVNEEIWDEQQEVFVGSMGIVKGRGNTFRIGRELVQYSGVDRRARKFTGVKRGVFKCTRGEYPVTVTGVFRPGERVDYLRSCYSSFYPVPDSPLMAKTAEAIDRVFNYCGMEEIYFDGSEGMGTRYDTDRMRENIFRTLDQGPNGIVNEASCKNAFHWWFRSRLWPWDHNWYGARRLHDLHMRLTLQQARYENFLGCNLGWWAPLTAAETGRGHFLDEMEYYMCKNAAYDTSMSMQGMYVTDGPLSFNVEKQATLMGWWERARMAKAFADGLQKKMQPYGEEFRLRQNGTGLWEVTPVRAEIHRAGSPETRAWTVKSGKAKKAELRVEALYGVKERYDSPNAKAYFTPGAKVEVTTAANVMGEVGAADSEKGKVFTISAANTGKTSRGAWLGAVEHHPYPNLVFMDGAFGTWVYGDGSGAILNFNLKLHSFNWGGRSEHYVKLDFKGWRYVTFLLRERDADWFGELDWPYAKNWKDARTVYNGPYWTSEPTVEFVGAWLNEIPAGGRTEVKFTELRSLGIVRPALEDAVVTLNGKDLRVPFTMAAGDFAELADGVWELYDEMGDVKARKTTGDAAELKSGDNAVAFRGKTAAARAEVTLNALDAAIPAFTDRIAEKNAKWLKYEAVMPRMFAPAKGFDQPVEIVTRPGEKAQLALDVWGPIDTPVFEIDGVKHEFPVKLGKLDHLICRDGRNWRAEHVVPGATKDEGGIWYKVAPSARRELKKGRLAKPLPEIEGAKSVKVSSKDDAKAEARIEFAKRYAKVKCVPGNPRAIASNHTRMTVDEITEGVRNLGRTVEVEYPHGGFALSRNTAGGNATDWTAKIGKGRTAKQKVFVVPPSLYRQAKIVVSVDPDRKLDRVFTVRFTRYNDGGNFGGRDFEGMVNVRVDFDKAEKRQLADGRWEVTVPLDLGKIADLVNGRDAFGTWLCNSLKLNPSRVRPELGNYLDFEVLSRLNDPTWRSPMQDARMIPDAKYTSALTVHSATLEKGPATFDWRCAQPGNVFHNDEKPVTYAIVDAKSPVTLRVTIGDAEGRTLDRREFKVEGRREIELGLEPSTFNLQPSTSALGWYSLDFELSDARGVFMTHNASFALLGKDTRTMKDGEGPYGTWTYGGNHYQDTNFHNVGALMLKAGLRKGEGVTNWPKNLRSKFLVGPPTINWNKYVKMTDEERVADFRKQLAVDPFANSFLMFHEDAPWSYQQAWELTGQKPPDPKKYGNAGWMGGSFKGEEALNKRKERHERAMHQCKVLRDHLPEVKITLGNSLACTELVAESIRDGLPAEYVDYMGIESVVRTQLPEREGDISLLMADAMKQTAAAFGGAYTNWGVNTTWESDYRMEQLLGKDRCAWWYVRDMIVQQAWRMPSIFVATLSDCGNSYGGSFWGQCGLTYRYPLQWPKKSYVGVAMATKMMDGVTGFASVPTGDACVYVAKFTRRDGKTVYAFWTSRGRGELQLELSGTDLEACDFYGRALKPLRDGGGWFSRTFTGKNPVYPVSEAVSWIVADGEVVVSAKAGKTDLSGYDAPEDARLVKATDTAADWRLAEKKVDAIEITTGPFFPYRTLGGYEVREVVDTERGKCLELELARPNPQLPLIMNEYAVLELKQPIPLSGEPATIGAWVKGNSGWGQFYWVIETPDKKRHYSCGQGASADVFDYEGRVSLCYTGWAYLSMPLVDRSKVKNTSTGGAGILWRGGSIAEAELKGAKLVGIAVDMKSRPLYLTERRETRQVIRLGGVYASDFK